MTNLMLILPLHWLVVFRFWLSGFMCVCDIFCLSHSPLSSRGRFDCVILFIVTAECGKDVEAASGGRLRTRC